MTESRFHLPKLIHATIVALALLTLACTTGRNPLPPTYEEIIAHSESQLALLLHESDSLIGNMDSLNAKGLVLVSPRTVNDKGDLVFIPSRDWCSGFFPGNLWIMHRLTGEDKWKEAAIRYTLPLEPEKLNGGTHDMGFKMMCSFGEGWKVTGDSLYREILLQSAKTLITRYSPVIGAIRSWDHNSDKWQYPVIIDNMMNLELLYWASKQTGDTLYASIANRHAFTTIANHFRSDYSSFHVIDFDTLSGAPLQKHTHQGLSHESAWARGQAWGLYGFTMAYRETGIEAFLVQAEKIAEFIMNHPRLPADLVPLWDYDAQGENEPRDVSAAAITASALYELDTFLPDSAGKYKARADKMMANIAMNYLSDPGTLHGFILNHATGHKPAKSEVDVPLNYADFYFLEALERQKKGKI